jgi:predicted RNase H-like HicB family nuclease
MSCDHSANGPGGIRVKTYLFRVELREEDDGRWSVWILGFPGLTSWGHTREEALRNIQDAAEAYLEDMREAGDLPTHARESVEVLDRPAVAVTIA